MLQGKFVFLEMHYKWIQRPVSIITNWTVVDVLHPVPFLNERWSIIIKLQVNSRIRQVSFFFSLMLTSAEMEVDGQVYFWTLLIWIFSW